MKKLSTLLSKNNDILLILVVVGILFILIIPFPASVLDFLLCLNFSATLLFLLITLNLKRALEFSVFPSVLLLITLFRLSLNVASTRLILLHGDAGSVIQAFGSFVVGGNPIVGVILFAILVIIQFIVITKGANRISEVAARFTLDAMPGKQMSIDADLNAGAISEEEAKQRREEISQEAEFYGAMDGSGKFVRGDAIAGLIIIVVNICAGLIIGVMNGLEVSQALQKYVILTVGDGLVGQIPALLIAITTGILTTKTSSESHLADELHTQFTRYPRTIATTAIIILVFGLVPGLPFFPFFILSVMIVAIYFLSNQVKQEEEAQQKIHAEVLETQEQKGPIEANWLKLDRLRIELGYKLIELADAGTPPTLMDRIMLLREQIARDLGMVIPPIHIVDNMQLPAHSYSIRLEGEIVAEDVLYPNHYLAIASGNVENSEQLSGIEVQEPAFGLKAIWIEAAYKEDAELSGYTVINSSSVLITHLAEVLKKHAYMILTRDDVDFLLELAKKQAPILVKNTIPDLFSLAEVQQILQNLLWEKIPIVNLPRILDTLSQNAPKTRDIAKLTELVRQNLSLTIVARYQGRKGLLPVITLAPDIEKKLCDLVSPGGANIGISPDYLQKIIDQIVAIKQSASAIEGEAVLLVNADIRRSVHEIIHHSLSDLPVLSFNEVMKVPQVKCIGMVQIEEENFNTVPV